MAQNSLYTNRLESSCWHFQGPLNIGGNIPLNTRMLLMTMPAFVCVEMNQTVEKYMGKIGFSSIFINKCLTVPSLRGLVETLLFSS